MWICFRTITILNNSCRRIWTGGIRRSRCASGRIWSGAASIWKRCVNLEAMRQLRTRDFYLISGANISLLLEMLFSEVSDGAQIEEIVNAAKDQMVYVNAMMGARSE